MVPIYQNFTASHPRTR